MIIIEDSAIVDLFFERSESAIEELSEKYEPSIRRVSQNVLQNTSDAEECISDTYLAVWNKIPPQRPDCLGAFVLRIARNIAIKRYRMNTAHKRNSYFDAALDELEACIPSAHSVEETVEANELARAINAFLRKLHRDERIMFTSKYWYSYTNNEIAKMMSMKDKHVAVCLFRTREKLRRFLSEQGVSV